MTETATSTLLGLEKKPAKVFHDPLLRSIPRYYILEDKKVVATDSLEEWSKWFEHSDRVINVTDVGLIGESIVSTVFLGLPAWPYNIKRPMVFETMVFGGKHDGDRLLASTYEEAVRKHQKMIKIVRKSLVNKYGLKNNLTGKENES